MRISVLSSFEADSQHAHAINTVKTAAGFAMAGHYVELVTRCPRKGGTTQADLQRQYGFDRLGRWIFLPRLLNKHLRFGLAACTVVLRNRPDVVFVRDYASAVFCSLLDVPVIMETHAHVGNRTFWFNQALRSSRLPSFALLVTISDTLRDHYVARSVPPDKVLVLPTGVNEEDYRPPNVSVASPYQSGAKRPVVTYTGHLYDYKGIPTILNAAAIDKNIDFHLVGGLEEDVNRVKRLVQARGLDNVIVHGWRHQSEVPPYLWHADVLLLPPTAHHPSARWTSPVKLGEYLASGTPVVATDIPALRDWLTDKEVEFVAPDDAQSLLNGVHSVLDNAHRAHKKALKGRRLAEKWSYVRRSAQILQSAHLPKDVEIRG